MDIITGSVVRPVITIAGLDARQLYRVTHIERASFGYVLAFLTDSFGITRPIENAHLVLEVVQTATLRPSAALPN